LHNFAQSAPIVAEVLAVQRGMAIAEATGSPIYILHVSSGRALKVIEDARRRGLPVYAETRPIYLHATAQKYQQPDVGLWIGGPPLRDKWDQDMLWVIPRPAGSISPFCDPATQISTPNRPFGSRYWQAS
jgi:dihydropyrimidinase